MTCDLLTTADRILAVTWTSEFEHVTSRGYLMKEYLRRAAWWAKATAAPRFPFFDIAEAVNPAIRADPAIVERITEHLAPEGVGVQVITACVRALHFAALVDANVPLPDAPTEPFEPLLMMFKRGGGFRVEGGGSIDVDYLGILPGTVEDNLRTEPYVRLDQTALDTLDEQAP
jgi:hypothetical protein